MMDMAAAVKQCSSVKQQVKSICAKCDSSVILHCERCEIQVTGCICTEVERFGNAEAVQRMMDRYGEQEARARLKRAGIWVPENN